MEICQNHTMPNESIGAPCSACGHTNLAHPGGQNPSLDQCAVCALVVLAEEGHFALDQTLKHTLSMSPSAQNG